MLVSAAGIYRKIPNKMNIYHHKIVLNIFLFMLPPAFIVGGVSSATTLTPSTAVPTAVAFTATSTTAASQNLNDTHVRVLGLWSGPELESFMTLKAIWEKNTGGIVDWEGTQDLPDVLTERMQAGNLPDIAILPNPGLMQQLAKEGNLVPLNSFMDMNQVNKEYAPTSPKAQNK